MLIKCEECKYEWKSLIATLKKVRCPNCRRMVGSERRRIKEKLELLNEGDSVVIEWKKKGTCVDDPAIMSVLRRYVKETGKKFKVSGRASGLNITRIGD